VFYVYSRRFDCSGHIYETQSKRCSTIRIAEENAKCRLQDDNVVDVAISKNDGHGRRTDVILYSKENDKTKRIVLL
jgi:hypothetical protein